MASVKIRTQGNAALEGIELENFSTEETLAALLEQFKAFSSGFTTDRTETKTKVEKNQSKLEKLLAGIGIGAGVTGAGNKVSDIISKAVAPVLDKLGPFATFFENLLEDITPEVFALVVAFKLVSLGLHVFQTALHAISRTVTSLFSVTGNLIGTLASGKTALSDYFAAIQRGTSSIPIIGEFTSLLAEGSIIVEAWNQSIYELTKIGANFGGSITELITYAADAGLSVEQFSRVVSENKDSLATFGSVMSGINTYTKVANISMRDYSDQLSGLGISFAQYSDELPKLLSIFGASMKAHGASDKELAQTAMDLTHQFDAMAQLTGKTRAQQADDLQKLTADAAWQQKLTKMSKNQQEGYLAGLNEIQNTMGEGYAELYKFSVLGMPPLNKELQILLATTPGLSENFKRMSNAAQSGVKGAQLTSQLNDIAADMVASGIRAGQSYETIIKAASAGLGGSAADIAKAQQQLLANKQDFFRNGQFDESLFRQKLAQLSRDREAQNKVSESLTKFSNLILVLRDKIYTQVIGPLLDKLAPAISTITRVFEDNQGPLQGFVNRIVAMVTTFGDWISTHGIEIKDYIDDFFTIIGDVMGFILGTVRFVMDHWTLIKRSVEVMAVLVSLTATVGLGWLAWQAGKALALFVSAVNAAAIGVGKAGFAGGLKGLFGKLGGGAVAAEGAEVAAGSVAGGSILGLGEGAVGAGSLATLVGGEAATGIGIPLAAATALLGGGYLLYKLLQNNDNKSLPKEEPNVEKQSYSQTSSNDDIINQLKVMNDKLTAHHNTLTAIAENTDIGARFSKKTAGALA